MWITLRTIDENMSVREVPINMDCVLTYARCTDPKFPQAKAVLYPAGGYIKTIPVLESTDEVAQLMENSQ